MPGAENGFFPPVDYSGWWVALAAVIVLVIVAFYVIVPIVTRARENRPAAVPSWIPAPASIREKYIDLIGEVEISHSRGELTVRAAHQKLSMLLRFYAYESSGIGAPQMTLADLRQTRATPLSDAVAKLYPASFREVERGSVGQAAGMARGVIESWN